MKLSEILQILKNEEAAFFFTPAFYDDAKSYIFKDHFKKIEISNLQEVDEKFLQIEDLLAKNYSAYTLIDYEFGYLLEKRLNKNFNGGKLEFYFCENENVIEINSDEIEFDIENIDSNEHSINNFKLDQTEKEYKSNIEKIKNYISEGETYQVNYTVKGDFIFEGEIDSLILSLIFNQSAKYISIINKKDEIIISISPELFFKIENGKIITQPMKGTIARGINLNDDEIQINKLKNSEKDLAENVMIVDLLRNDLGKVSKSGSVNVENLFKIEKYESLFQMVSEISGELKNEIKFTGIIKNLFPCGSITGAPKIRTMEIIRELENHKRGIYTGSIGFITNKKVIFNVAIRTIELNKQNGKGEIGLGSGIVYDSIPEKEFEEVLLKSKFLTEPQNYFEIFESILIEDKNLFLKDQHLKRMKNAAEFFLFKFDESKIENEISKVLEIISVSNKYKLKLVLNKWGKVKSEISELNGMKKSLNIILSKEKISSRNKFQYFKTTNRNLYDSEFNFQKEKGFDEVFFINEKDEICEGAISNIFLKKENIWVTPPLDSGILNGVYREYFLSENKNSKVEKIKIDDLKNCDEIMIVNSVRGKMKVEKLFLNENEFISFL